MCHNTHTHTHSNHHINALKLGQQQKGSSLVIAIFIIVVVLLLATALVNMLNSSSNTIAVQVIGTRAYAAAHTGAEYKLQQIFPLAPAASNCDDVIGFSLSNVDGLPKCSFDVTCESFDVQDVTYYTVESTGTCNYQNTEQTSRTIVVEARSL